MKTRFGWGFVAAAFGMASAIGWAQEPTEGQPQTAPATPSPTMAPT